MTITHEGTGVVATATSGASNPITCSPAFPAGYTKITGHYAVITVVSRHDTEATPTITAGWDQEPGMSASGGGGAFGAGTGPARITKFVRRIVDTDSAPTVSLAGTNTGRTLQAVMSIISTTADYIRFAYAFQAEATAATGWSEAFTTPLQIKNGDFLFVSYGVRDDQHAAFSAMGISATDATISAVTERADAITGNGNDQGIGVGTTACTAGVSTVTGPTVTATIGAAESGEIGVLRCREFTDGTTPNEVDSYIVGFNGSAASRVTKNFQAKTGDILVVGAGTSDTEATIDSISGGSLTWTQLESISTAGNLCALRIWWAEVDADKNMAITVNYTPGVNSQFTGLTAFHHSNADSVGAAESAAGSGAPSLAITTTQDNSSIDYWNFDWAAVDGVSRTWRTINSITPTAANGLEAHYVRDASFWATYSACWNDAGTTGSKTTGLSAPSGQTLTNGAVEVKAPAVGGESTTLTPATITFDGVSLSPKAQASLTPAVVTFAGIPLVAKSSIGLTPAPVVFAGVPLQARSIVPLTPAGITFAGVPLIAKSVIALTSAEITFAGVPLAPEGGASTVTLTPAVITFNGVSLIAKPIVPLTPAQFTLAGVALQARSIVPLTPASITFGAIALAPVHKVNLTPAVITFIGVALSPELPGGTLRPTIDVVAIALVRHLSSLADNLVDTQLPDASVWANTGFVQTFGIQENSGMYVPNHASIASVNGWATKTGSSKPPWNMASQLVEQIKMACYSPSKLPVTLDLSAFGDYKTARVHTAYFVSEPRRMLADDGSFAHYEGELIFYWTPQDE